MRKEQEVIAFCEATFDGLVRFLQLQLGNKMIAEEIAQESLARAWARWSKISKLENPSAWTYRVAINLARSHQRRQAIEKRVLRRTPSQQTSERDVTTKLALEDAIGLLPHRQRTAVLLRYYVDLPYQDIGDALDMPAGTARSLVHRALEKLRVTTGMMEVEDVIRSS